MTFDLDKNGDIITFPLRGWVAAPVADSTVLLRLEFAKTPAELKTKPSALQMTLTPIQALDLAAELQTQAQRIHALRPAGPAN